MIKYIKIMVTVFTLLISCSVTNIFASDTNDVIEEKIDISENIIDEVGEDREEYILSLRQCQDEEKGYILPYPL